MIVSFLTRKEENPGTVWVLLYLLELVTLDLALVVHVLIRVPLLLEKVTLVKYLPLTTFAIWLVVSIVYEGFSETRKLRKVSLWAWKNLKWFAVLFLVSVWLALPHWVR